MVAYRETMHTYMWDWIYEIWYDPKLSVNVFSELEDDFRDRYSTYLRTMKQRIYDTYLGFNELEDERKMVNQQVIRTPGRRGEMIKNEEIDKEFSRRYGEYKKAREFCWLNSSVSEQLQCQEYG